MCDPLCEMRKTIEKAVIKTNLNLKLAKNTGTPFGH